MISVVIPTWSEAGQLPATLAALAANPVPHEILVVDAGSADATCTIAGAAGATVLASPIRQRAAQMNLGAARARGDVLLFLHADTRLRPDALAQITRAVLRAGVVGGAFARRFDHPSRLLRFTAALADWRSRVTGWFLGDQAIFARRAAFDQLGGYREWDRFEDLDFARRLRNAGRTVLLAPPIVSSGRRFEAGVARRVAGDVWLTLRYLARGRPPTLHRTGGPKR